MTGPVASDGPRFVAVSVTVPVVPGVIVGVVTARARSATGAATTMLVGVTVLSAGDGSAEADVTDTGPPVSVP